MDDYDEMLADYAREDDQHYTHHYVNDDGEPTFG